jgi:hypothetical protein
MNLLEDINSRERASFLKMMFKLGQIKEEDFSPLSVLNKLRMSDNNLKEYILNSCPAFDFKLDKTPDDKKTLGNRISTHIQRRKDLIKVINLLLEDFEITEYSEYIVKNLPRDKAEFIRFAISLWPLVNNDKEKYITILVSVWHPFCKIPIISNSDFFDVIWRVIRYWSFDENETIKLVLNKAQDIFEILYKDEEDKLDFRYISEFYPFSKSSIDEMWNWLVGEKTRKVTFSGKEYILNYGDASARLVQHVLDWFYPQLYNIEDMLIIYWIRQSKKQLTDIFGNSLTQVIIDNIEKELNALPMDFIWDYKYNNDSYLVELICDNEPLPVGIIEELTQHFLFYDMPPKAFNDVALKELPARLFSLIKEVTQIPWSQVLFGNSRITIRFDAKNGPSDFQLDCESSSSKLNRIIAENDFISNAMMSLPMIHCGISDYGIVEILNKKQVKNIVNRLASVCLNKNAYINIANDSQSVRLQTNKNECFDFLMAQKIASYPIVDIKEKCNTLSNDGTEENASVFVVKETNDKLHLVYENESLMRSSYVFVIKKSSYDDFIKFLRSYFSSDASNKRQHLLYDMSIFKRRDEVVNVKRINHKDLAAWRNDILCE